MEAHATPPLKIAPAPILYFSGVGVESHLALSTNPDNSIEEWWKPPGERKTT